MSFFSRFINVFDDFAARSFAASPPAISSFTSPLHPCRKIPQTVKMLLTTGTQIALNQKYESFTYLKDKFELARTRAVHLCLLQDLIILWV